jgi:predicted phage terminase large subunit-like protein
LIGLEAKRSKAELLKAIGWNANIESLAIDAYSTTIHWIGTRWGKNDLYADIIRRYGDDLKIFSRGAIEGGRIIFPEKYNWKFYRRLMEESPDIWAAQYMNDPTSDVALDFDSANIRYFKFDSDGNVVYKEKGQYQRWHWTELDRVITCDPNSGSKTAPDQAAIVVSGQAPDEKAFVLKTYARRDDPSEYVDAIFELAMRWRPRVVGIEQAGQQNTIHHFEKKMKREGVYFNVVPLKHMNRVKEERIRTSLEPIIASQELFVLHSQTELIEQLKNYPDVANDDVVDALAYAVEHWRPGIKAEAAAANRKIVKRLLSQRNPLTGYGPSLVR